ncbi:hypothetical protein MJH12_05545 [bacterium]|nr:hypothetical protein [bacterium]
MQQLIEIVRLKLMISERKLIDQVGIKKAPMELFFVIAILMFSALFSFMYMVVTFIHFSYRFEMLGFLFGVYLLSFALTPLLGGRLGEFLDFKALFFYPIDHKKMFLSSVLSSLLDLVMIPFYALTWGGVIGLCVLSSFFKLPLYLLLFTLQILFCICISQQLFLFYQFILRRTQWYQFFVTFLLPVGGVILLFYSYGSVLLQLPFVEEFSRPDYPFLAYTFWFPSSAIALALKAVYHSNWIDFLAYFTLLLVQFSLLIFCGSYLVSKVQLGNDSASLVQRKSVFGKKIRFYINRFHGESNVLFELIYKDLLLFFREPYVKTMVFIPLFMSALAWFVSYLTFSVKVPLLVLLQDILRAFPENIGFVEQLIVTVIALFVHTLETLPDKQWVLMIWPFYFYGAMLVIATEASVKIYRSLRWYLVYLLL